MIFIGYANDDRYDIVESIVFHLKNWGFDTWYDFHNMYLGDNRQKTNFEHGIGESDYVIFVISNNTFQSPCAKEELLYSRSKWESGEIVFFPIFYEMAASELPREYFWLRKLIYNEVTKKTGTFYVTNQIIEKILLDYKNQLSYRSIDMLLDKFQKDQETYLSELCGTLNTIDLDNYNARLGILYAAFKYIYTTICKNSYLPTFGIKIIERIFSLTRLNISIDHLTYGIFQDTLIIDMNYYIHNL